MANWHSCKGQMGTWGGRGMWGGMGRNGACECFCLAM